MGEIKKVRIPWAEWTAKGGARAQTENAPEGYFPVSYNQLPDAMEVNYAEKATSEPAVSDVAPAKKTKSGAAKKTRKGRR